MRGGALMARLRGAMNDSKTNETVEYEAVEQPEGKAGEPGVQLESSGAKGEEEVVAGDAERASSGVEAPEEQKEEAASVSKAEEGSAANQSDRDAAEQAVQEARAEAARFREQMLRVAADFDNFRKRSRKENEDGARRAREDLLRDLLPVFDNLERAVTHAEQATDVKAVADGVKIVLKQFRDTVGRFGVQRLDTERAVFDPTVHEAIQQVVTADQPAGTIVAEVQPGYVWGDRLVRAAMVVVAKAPPAPCVPEEAPSEPAN